MRKKLIKVEGYFVMLSIIIFSRSSFLRSILDKSMDAKESLQKTFKSTR